MTQPLPTGGVSITFAGQAMVLLPGRAIWWPGPESLVIADLHLGKAASFRAGGIPVPSGGTARDLSRLSALLLHTGARRLVILGDFLHARAGRQPEVFDEMTRWREQHAKLGILLIRGNHDRSAGRSLPEWNIEEVEEPHPDNEIVLLHDPVIEALAPALAGHVHPVSPVRDYDGSTINLPSFVVDADRLILPAFGSFTGGFKMHPQPGRRIFHVIAGRIIPKRV